MVVASPSLTCRWTELSLPITRRTRDVLRIQERANIKLLNWIELKRDAFAFSVLYRQKSPFLLCFKVCKILPNFRFARGSDCRKSVYLQFVDMTAHACSGHDWKLAGMAYHGQLVLHYWILTHRICRPSRLPSVTPRTGCRQGFCEIKSNQIKSNLFAQTNIWHYTWLVKSVYEQGQQGWEQHL